MQPPVRVATRDPDLTEAQKADRRVRLARLAVSIRQSIADLRAQEGPDSSASIEGGLLPG